jgi:flavin-dependent dehydrogenase
VKPWTDCVEVHWGANCQIYVTPVSAMEVGIALVSRDSHLRLDAALPAFPSLAERLSSASHSSEERGAVSMTRSLRRVSKGRVALIGDASGSVDAITGEGLGLTFQQAPALADALVQGSFAGYERAHRAIARRPAFMGQILLLLDAHPRFRQCVLHALQRRPGVFEKILAAHTGAITPPHVIENRMGAVAALFQPPD